MERSSSSSSSSSSHRSSFDGQGRQVEQQPVESSSSTSGKIRSMTRYWWSNPANNTLSTAEQSTFPTQEMGRQLSEGAETSDRKRAKGNEGIENTSLFNRITGGIFRWQESDLGTLAQNITRLEKAYQASPSLKQLQKLENAYSKYLQALDPALQEKEGKLGEIQTKQGYYKMLKLYNDQIVKDMNTINTGIKGSISIQLGIEQTKESIEESRQRIKTLLPLRDELLQQISALEQSSESLQSQEISLEGEIDQLESHREQAKTRLTEIQKKQQEIQKKQQEIQKKQQEIQKKQQEIQKKQQELSQLLSFAPHDNLTSQIFGPDVNYSPYEVNQDETNRTTLTPHMGRLALPEISISENLVFGSWTDLPNDNSISFDQLANRISSLNRSQVTTETPQTQVQDTSQQGASDAGGASAGKDKGKGKQTEQDAIDNDAQAAENYQRLLNQEWQEEQETLIQNDSNLAANQQQEEYNAALRSRNQLESTDNYFDNYFTADTSEVSQYNNPIRSAFQDKASSSSAFPFTNEIPQNQSRETPEHSDSDSITESVLDFFSEPLLSDKGDTVDELSEQTLNRIPWTTNELQTLAGMYVRVKKTSLLSTDSDPQAATLAAKLKAEGLRNEDYRIIQKFLKSKWKNNELDKGKYDYIRDKIYKQSDKGKEKTSEIQERYIKSDKGKTKMLEGQKRYKKSDKGRATQGRYRESDKGRETKSKSQKKYRESDKGRETDGRYKESDKGRETKSKSQKKYRESDKGKAAQERAIRKATDAEIMLNYQENVIILDEENFEKTASSSSEESKHDEE